MLIAVSYACVLSSCGNNVEHSITIAGSTSVQPYAEMLMEEFAHIRPDIAIDIQGGGSSAGITAVESGAADIGMSSRSLKEKESGLIPIEIALDGLAVIVHPKNPVSDLTAEQICDIYMAKITNWKDVGGNDAKIHIISREEGSGTRSAFEELLMEKKPVTPKAIVQNSNGTVRQLVCDDVNAIGFISLGLVEQLGTKPVKALAIDGVAASQENIENGSYKLYRPFLFVLKEEPQGATKEFIDYVLSEEGQKLLVDEGLILSLKKGNSK